MHNRRSIVLRHSINIVNFPFSSRGLPAGSTSLPNKLPTGTSITLLVLLTSSPEENFPVLSKRMISTLSDQVKNHSQAIIFEGNNFTRFFAIILLPVRHLFPLMLLCPLFNIKGSTSFLTDLSRQCVIFSISLSNKTRVFSFFIFIVFKYIFFSRGYLFLYLYFQ